MPLVNAERAWATAMEMKHQDEELAPKAKHYMTLKLRKAVKWAEELARVANARWVGAAQVLHRSFRCCCCSWLAATAPAGAAAAAAILCCWNALNLPIPPLSADRLTAGRFLHTAQV